MFKSGFTGRSERSSRRIQPRLAPPATQQLTHRRIRSISYHRSRLRFSQFSLATGNRSQDFLSFCLCMTVASFLAGLTMRMRPDDRWIGPRALSRSNRPTSFLFDEHLNHIRPVGSQDRGLNAHISNFHSELLTKSPRLCLDQTPIFTSHARIILPGSNRGKCK
jgi:hypothetical protein